MAILTRAFLAPLISAAALAGCTRAPDPAGYTDAAAAVHAVLAAGASSAGVLVTRFVPGAAAPEPVSGAEVTLARDGATLVLAERPGSGTACFGERAAGAAETDRGCYAAPVPGGIAPGERWSLRVRFPTGELATGTAVIPDFPVLVKPAQDARVTVLNGGAPLTSSDGSQSVATIGVRWEAPVDPARAELSVAVARAFAGERILPASLCRLTSSPAAGSELGSRSLTVAVYAAECAESAAPGAPPVRWDSMDVTLAVAAYDTAYARYAREVLGRDATRRERAAAGVHGALGLFAGAAPATVRLLFRPAN